MKRFFIRLWEDIFLKKEETTYLAVNTKYKTTDNWPLHGIFECIEGKNLEEITDYLDNEVPKSQRKYWKIYEELLQQEAK